MRYESADYKVFKADETRKKSLYERACRFSSRIIGIEPDKNMKKKIQDAIDFSKMQISPKDAASLPVVLMIFVCIPLLIMIPLNLFLSTEENGKIIQFGPPWGYSALALVLALFFIYYLYTYPLRLRKRYEMEAGSDIVTLILYMAMHMRNSPNMERAVKFASQNLSEPLAGEIRKLMWDVEVGNYTTIENALVDYTKKWSNNKEFIQAIEMLIASLSQTEERRVAMLNETMEIILDGNREIAKHFNQQLKMPVMAVHAMGIILPVLGLVMFPLVAVFLGIGAEVLFIGYDVILPFVLFFIITNILEGRPATFSKIDVSENPDIPQEGKFRFGGKLIPAWPFALLVAVAMIIPGVALYSPSDIIAPILITGGIAFGFATYYYLLTYQRLKLREETREIENEFTSTMFQLGNSVYGGTPIEASIEKSIKRTQNLKVKELFIKTLRNMKTFGMTFKQSLFDSTRGAIRYYPSKLIKTSMKIVVNSAERGSRSASLAMLSISKYLKGLHETQEDIREELSDPVSSMKFQAFFLSPLVSGIVITMTIVILKILATLGAKSSDAAFFDMFENFAGIGITNAQFIIIVAVYLIETCFILSYFINGIENGRDDIGRKSITAATLALGFIIFIITFSVTMMILGPLISSIY
ncbi:MAG: hypothetical protein V1900_03180 [Candidatus Aenigmatarchaeota archaeon]